MTKIKVNKDNNNITSIEVIGHTGYNEIGKDIVCASISSIVTTTINGIIRLDNSIKYESKEGFLKIEILNHTNITDTLIDNMLELLEELEKDYKDYVKIIK
ncbi:MAG: ribosomal-processing cysteine protease Prp [Clostridium sp.]|nr:ribosomal-processing cysteine protease Prp [Clostridium sp.]MCM1444485.1 ribosomal-processing cysteine protease Prp [Candidatus Amulumruptor caecigallinarius]